MRFNRLLLVVPFVFAAVVGCSPKCESLCDDYQDEDCKDFDHDACIGQCAAAEDMKDDTDKCSNEWDDLMSCIGDQDDICKTNELDDDGKFKKCNSEFNDYGECMADYCADHESRDYCN